MEKADVLDAILMGLEKTACIIARCAIYESLYLNGARTEAADNLHKSTVQLYTAILMVVAKAIAKSKGALSGSFGGSGNADCSTSQRVTSKQHSRPI